MEKNIVSWITIVIMWVMYGIYPVMSKSFSVTEITVSLLMLTGLTIYGFFYKEKQIN